VPRTAAEVFDVVPANNKLLAAPDWKVMIGAAR
jgi:hypothetical protein